MDMSWAARLASSSSRLPGVEPPPPMSAPSPPRRDPPVKRTTTHWGTYEYDERNGTLSPTRDDPDPARLSDPLAGSPGDTARILTPAVRSGYMEHGPRRGDNRRGAEPFVAVSW